VADEQLEKVSATLGLEKIERHIFSLRRPVRAQVLRQGGRPRVEGVFENPAQGAWPRWHRAKSAPHQGQLSPGLHARPHCRRVPGITPAHL